MAPSPSSKPTVWQTLRPIFLREAIVVLEGITHLLSQATAQLKATATTQNIPPAQLDPQRSWLRKLNPWLQRCATIWWQAMGWLQQRLPPGLRDRYNRTTLTAITVGTLLLLFWLNPLSWFQPAQRSNIHSSATRAHPDAAGTILVQPRRSTTVAPSPAPMPMPTVTPVPPPAPRPSPALATSDMATVRQQLVAICNRYSNALAPTLTLNPSEQRLDLMLSTAWYDLSAAKQDQLAQALWQQAHDLGYTTVVITDTQGQPLIRDPVVGNNAIVVRRKLP